MKRRHQYRSLEDKWNGDYRGTGIWASRDGNEAIVLREALNGIEYAIVRMTMTDSGIPTTSATNLKVVKVIDTDSLPEAKAEFDQYAAENGYSQREMKTILDLFDDLDKINRKKRN